MGGRLVEDEQARLLGEGARDDAALALTAAQMIEWQIREPEHTGRRHRGAGGRSIERALEIAPGPMRVAAHQHQIPTLKGTRPRPLRHDRDPPRQLRAAQPANGLSSRRISPAAGSSTRVSSRISVVLPELFGPITPTISPGATSSETSTARRDGRVAARCRIREAYFAEFQQHHALSMPAARSRAAGRAAGSR